ncbi:type III PLP-dependent enzyme [Kitasatospora purpeofusca]|uniref:type III PLP-dependent enzyme n=1 Tax=Kitasatospora purpeofusca TaxID=67352 RepID=UPI0035DC7030
MRPDEAARLIDIVHTHGSPCYVHRLDRIRAAAAELRAAVPADAELFYSLKANPHPLVVEQITRLGLRAEASSTGELRTALAAGQRPDQVLYTGPGKTPAEVTEAVASGVELFSVESVTDYQRVADLAEDAGTRVRCLARVNAGQATAGPGLRMSGAPSQFGTDLDRIGELRHPDRDRFAPLIGCHVFSATNIADGDALAREFAVGARAAAQAARSLGIEPSLVDLGGGFGSPFARPGNRSAYPHLRAALTGLLDAEFPTWRTGAVRPAFESGRFLTGESGTLLCTVLDVKQSRDRTYVVLDAGTNVLGGYTGLGRLLPPRAVPTVLSTPDLPGEPRPLDLVGPLCTPADVLARAVTMPVPPPGSVLAIPNVGAYGLTAALTGFLSRPLPAVAVLDGGGETPASARPPGRHYPESPPPVLSPLPARTIG